MSIHVDKIKVVLDYLFYDIKRSYISYLRFVECFSFINNNSIPNLNLFHIFKEICGHKRKYITISRFIIAYKKYISNDSNISLQTKKFFSLLFTDILIANNTKYAGFQTNQMLYSSRCYQIDKELTQLKLFSFHKEITGIELTYNNIYKALLYNTKYKYLFSQEINIELIKNNNAITHIYGTFTDHITFIGFKLRNGQMLHYGDPKGQAFIYGSFAKVISGFKLEISDSNFITMLIPLYNDSHYVNKLVYSLNEKIIQHNDINNNTELLFEEKYFLSLSMNDDIIKFNLCNDYNKQNIKYEDIWTATLGGIDCSKEDIKKEAIQYYKNYVNKKKKKFVDKHISSSKEKHCLLKNGEWTGSAMKTITIDNILNDTNYYNLILLKLKFEIEREIHKELLKFEYEDNFDYYDNYLWEYELLEPFSLSPKHFDTYDEIKQIQNDFNSFINNINSKEKDTNTYKHQIENELYTIKSLQNTNSNNLWKMLSIKLKRFYIYHTIGCLISLNKALKILSTIEDEFYDEKTTLTTKISVYKYLYKNRHYTNKMLAKVNGTKYIRNYINHQSNLLLNGDSNQDHIEQEENEEEQIVDLEIANSKLCCIKDMIKEYPFLYKQLTLLYSKYRSMKIILVEELNQNMNNNIITNTKDIFKYNNIIEEIQQYNKQNDLIMIIENKKHKYQKYIKATPLYQLSFNNNIRIYANQLIVKDKDYIDKSFPPNSQSLGYESENIKWEKISTLFKDNYCILPQKQETFLKEKTFIYPGTYKNFNFISAMNTILLYPHFLYNLFPSLDKTNNNQYCLYLKINGIWKLVLIDGFIPTINSNIIYSSLNTNHIWIYLIEKAFAKLHYTYQSIQNLPIHDIYNLITEAPSNTIQISSLSNEMLIQLIQNELKQNYIITAKSNNSKCFDNGIIPEAYYTIKDIKLYYIGALSEYLITLYNPFGVLKYSGDWSSTNYKWIPSLTHNITNNENEFHISIDDFMSNYSILNILKVFPNENELKSHYSYIKYKKRDACSPNITLLKINTEQKIQITIQFYQKYYFLKHKQQKQLVLSFLFICDKKGKFIKSISSNESSFHIDLELFKGEYLIYSDMPHRYFNPNNPNEWNSYVISTYSNYEISLEKYISNENKPIDILKNALIHYSIKNLPSLKGDFGMKIFEYKKNTFNTFPFIFNIYLNNSHFDNELTIHINKKYDNVKNYAFYLENESFNSKSQHKEETFIKHIKANTNEVIMLYQLNNVVDYTMEYELETKITEKELLEYILKNGLREQLDEEEMLIQYMIEYQNGYCVLIENKCEDEAFDMKLMLKGLVFEGNVGDVFFKLKEQEIKLFKLQVSEGVDSGIVSFQFQFADM